jgi:predicted TIM-barrel fold metal-dependent hydrolase
MIGSDWPYTKNAPLGYREWFDAVRNLKIPEKVLELGIGIKDFSNEEKKMILGENAKTLLKI